MCLYCTGKLDRSWVQFAIGQHVSREMHRNQPRCASGKQNLGPGKIRPETETTKDEGEL